MPARQFIVDGLDDSLAAIAADGVDTFYRGDIARLIARDIDANGGLLSLADLEAYEAHVVPALEVTLDDWQLATSTVPSIGGAALAAMLLLTRGIGARCNWTPDMVRRT